MYVCILHLLRTNMSCKWDGKSFICPNGRCGRRAADYIQKAVWKKWVFNLDLMEYLIRTTWRNIGKFMSIICVDLSDVGYIIIVIMSGEKVVLDNIYDYIWQSLQLNTVTVAVVAFQNWGCLQFWVHPENSGPRGGGEWGSKINWAWWNFFKGVAWVI